MVRQMLPKATNLVSYRKSDKNAFLKFSMAQIKPMHNKKGATSFWSLPCYFIVAFLLQSVSERVIVWLCYN